MQVAPLLKRKPLNGSYLDKTPSLMSGLIGFWPMIEGGGTKVKNQIGPKYDGALSAGVSWKPSTFGLAPFFDYNVFATTNINVGDTTELNSASKFSISCWLSKEATALEAGMGKVLDANNRIHLIWTTTDNMAFNISNGSAASGQVALGGFKTLHHVVLVYDGTQASNATKCIGYIDGIAQTLNFGATTIPATTANLSTVPLQFGNDSFFTSQVYNGFIDLVLLYNRPITALEASLLYNNPLSFYQVRNPLIDLIGSYRGGGGASSGETDSIVRRILKYKRGI